MKHYILTEDTPWGNKGEEYMERYYENGYDPMTIASKMIGLEIGFILLKLGVLEEVREDGKWLPKEGDKYCFIYPDSSFGNTIFGSNPDRDSWCIKTDNVFRTKEEALAYKERILKGV